MDMKKRKTNHVQKTIRAGTVKWTIYMEDGTPMVKSASALWRSRSRMEKDLYFKVDGNSARLESHLATGRVPGTYEYIPL